MSYSHKQYIFTLSKIPRVWVNVHVGFVCLMALIAGMWIFSLIFLERKKKEKKKKEEEKTIFKIAVQKKIRIFSKFNKLM